MCALRGKSARALSYMVEMEGEIIPAHARTKWVNKDHSTKD
jgi:hypothetical protein